MNFSFCTTCRDRFADLQFTLPENLHLLQDDEELILLDYNGRDDLLDWTTTLTLQLVAGRLHVYRERTAPRFFMAHAKNVAHLLGRGRVLVNLDADNYLTPDYLQVLRSTNWDKVWTLYPHEGSGGFKGRVAIRADIFRELGGFDEDLNKGYGYEEIDLYRRLRRLAIRTTKGLLTSKQHVAHVVVNPDSAIATPQDRKADGQADGWTVTDSQRAHRRICEANLKAGKLVANQGRPWGLAYVYDLNNKPVLVSS